MDTANKNSLKRCNSLPSVREIKKQDSAKLIKLSDISLIDDIPEEYNLAIDSLEYKMKNKAKSVLGDYEDLKEETEELQLKIMRENLQSIGFFKKIFDFSRRDSPYPIVGPNLENAPEWVKELVKLGFVRTKITMLQENHGIYSVEGFLDAFAPESSGGLRNHEFVE